MKARTQREYTRINIGYEGLRLSLEKNTTIGIAYGLSMSASSMHRNSSTLDLVAVRLAVENNDNRFATLREIVFPSLFECGSKEFDEAINGVNTRVWDAVRGCEMKQCHKLYN